LCDVGRFAVKHCFKLLSFFTFIMFKNQKKRNMEIINLYLKDYWAMEFTAC